MGIGRKWMKSRNIRENMNEIPAKTQMFLSSYHHCTPPRKYFLKFPFSHLPMGQSAPSPSSGTTPRIITKINLQPLFYPA
jgi:hypothetical protein